MATYESLTDQQKADLAEAERYWRGLFSSLAGVAKTANATTMAQWIADNVDPILDVVDGTEVVPNSSNLGGAKDLTQSELLELQVLARTLLGMYQTNMSLLVRAIGVNV